MRAEHLKIESIPAMLWGRPEDRGIIAVHGSQSHKADEPIRILAENAVAAGYQVLSFDLPGHGDRRHEDTPCRPRECVAELATVMAWARSQWRFVSLFANSLGVYYSLMAYSGEPLERAWFLSPLVDMQRMIENMMAWSGVTGEQLRREQAVATPIGQTLYWDDYTEARQHPVSVWPIPTEILYGEKDGTCERGTVEAFAARFSSGLTVVPDGEHYFHTPEQLRAFDTWLKQTGLGRDKKRPAAP
ncbi:alpha/beta hydrolase [Eubacterium sp. 1001713B170207_170306_E7]|uniref:alpha/beta hydrolase n=1 Tax=Eubacterium sp. 1001713B170207_170306_E7 TaxID=2787097 RepID=UPI001896C00C|nr:alpha/beta hydrolase [Eubacterium sp. 1001713B170207_170306_E7]